MGKLKVAVLQTKVSSDKEENLDRAAALLEGDELWGADLFTLPEMFCCPYTTANFPLYAEEEGGPIWRRCAELARVHKVYLAAGSMPERDESGRVYNTAYVFDREGRMIAKHRKMHLFDVDVAGGVSFRESDTLSPGDAVTVFPTEFGPVGLCICYDLRFPELSRLMIDRGAKVVLVPAAFNMTTGPAHWELLFRQRAVDNQAFFVGIAPARDPESGYTSWGHSIAVDPWGTVLMQMDEKERFALVELDLDRADQIRDQLPLLRQRRGDVYRLEQVEK